MRRQIQSAVLITLTTMTCSAFATDSCSTYLRPGAIRKFFDYRVLEIPGSEGFRVVHPERHPEDEGVTVYIPHLVHYYSQWRSEVWSLGNEMYSFIDVGFKNLEADAQELNRTVLSHMSSRPKENLTVRFGPDRIAELELFHRLRWAVHERVLASYRKEKSGLSEEDFQTLKYLNRVSSNSDVFALTRFTPGRRWADFTTREGGEQIIAAMQVSYYGDQNFFRPTIRGMETLVDSTTPPVTDRLPFEYRIHPDLHAEFRDRLYHRFEAKNTCEITRYFKDLKDLPRPFVDRLLLEIVDTLIARGMKTIVVSTDAKTLRLFRSYYNFKVWDALPVRSESLEYLAYLELDSQEFVEAYTKIMRMSLDVRTDWIYHE